MADAVLLMAILPANPRIAILAAGENLTAKPLIWWLVKHSGNIFVVDRAAPPGKAVDRDAVYKALREDHISLLIFPEGRLGEVEGVINWKMKSGATEFAENTDAAVFPIGITGTTRLWWFRRVTLRFGPQIQYASGMSVPVRVELERIKLERLIEPYRARIGPKLFQKKFPQKRKKYADWRAERERVHKVWDVDGRVSKVLDPSFDAAMARGSKPTLGD